MNYAAPEVLDGLAAEYVLGTLRGRARARYERVLREVPMARQYLNTWEMRLSRLAALDAATPPAGAREALMHAIAPTAETNGVGAVPVSRPRRWTRWAIAASMGVIGLGLSFVAGQHMRANPTFRLASTRGATTLTVATLDKADSEDAAQTYLAELRLPSSSMGWLLGISPDRKRISAVAADDLLTLGRRRAELWLELPDGSMTALGALPLEGGSSVVYELPDNLHGHDEATFAISLEPEGAGPSKTPRAPVLVSVRSADLI